jgi:diguanylate cyclase (GGDEF)-like protein
MSTVSYNYLQFTQKNIKELSINHLNSIGNISLNGLKKFLNEKQEQVKLFNSNLLLQNICEEYFQNPNKRTAKHIKIILDASYSAHGQISDIIILDTNARIIASKNNSIKEDDKNIQNMMKKSFNKSYAHLSFIGNEKTPFLCISEPIFKDKSFLGITIFKFALDELNEMLEQRDGLGNSGEVLLGTYNKNRDIVLFTPLRFSEYPLVISHKELKLAVPMRNALNSIREKVVQEGIDYRNKNVISVIRYFKPLNLGVVVKKDIKELEKPANELRKKLFLITLIAIIISVFISYIFSIFAIRPIKHIAKISSQIADGNFNNRIEIFPNDEVGEMAHSINKMADTIVNINTNLEKKVEQKTKKLSETNQKLNHIFDITPNITILTDGKTIIKVNRQFLEFTEYSTLNEFLKDYDCICDMFHIQKGYLKPKIGGQNWTEYMVSHLHETHKAIIKKDGIENLFLVNATTYVENNNTNYIVVFENITELQKIAYTDQLTKLFNRLKIDEMLERCYHSFNRYKRNFTVILIDIDDFKKVNDTCGHLVGDEVLKSISFLLNENTRNIDFIGRWGGEEFIIISKETNIDGAFVIAEKIRQAVASFVFDANLRQTISIGIAQHKKEDTIDSLIKRADDALYKAKEKGKNRVESIA